MVFGRGPIESMLSAITLYLRRTSAARCLAVVPLKRLQVNLTVFLSLYCALRRSTVVPLKPQRDRVATDLRDPGAPRCFGMVPLKPRRSLPGSPGVSFRRPTVFGRGLIEACYGCFRRDTQQIPSAALCRGLIEAVLMSAVTLGRRVVIRGNTPRPR